ncbi:MAG: hypothetical protein WAL25_03125 [Acidimicrobiia bacterium]
MVNKDGHVEFDADLFTSGVRHLRQNRDERAAGELIVIGEQNLVRETFTTEAPDDYKGLYAGATRTSGTSRASRRHPWVSTASGT